MRRLIDAETVPLRGGAVTVREPALLPFGTFSFVQNMRPKRSGFIKRLGQAKHHATADGSNKVMTLYQFRKARVDEQHFYAQMSDSDVLEATDDPADPTPATAGVFGAEQHSGIASPKPATWSNLDDVLLYSNGVDQHQCYGGNSSYVSKFIVAKDTENRDIPEMGEDYSLEVGDGSTTTVAVLDSLSTYANNDSFYVCTPVPAKSFAFVIAAANGNASVMDCFYRKNNNTWAEVASGVDNTDSGGACLAVNGTFTLTQPTDEVPDYLFGRVGFWYQFRVTAALDAEVEISSVKFDSAFKDIVNMWDGIPQFAIEAQVEGTTTYETYAAVAVDLDAFPTGKKLMIASTDPIEGVYWDVGNVPNATGTALTSFKYWDGTAMQSVGTVQDETNGLSSTGWMTFPQQAPQPVQFGTSRYYAYWYEVIFDTNLSSNMLVGIEVMPYFSMSDFGKAGNVNAVWRDHMCYTFDKWSEYVYITPPNRPLTLNGDQYGILEAGDGRPNEIKSMKAFFNNLIVWQEEKGLEGGCTTIFQGYDPTTYGKLILSTHIGIMNSKCSEVVDGVMVTESIRGGGEQKERKTMAYWLSRYGVMATNGRAIWVISDDIQNYFDPTLAESVRRGYEAEHWLKYDSAYNVLRIGLVSGSSATVPNIFLVYDITDQVWYFDNLGQELSCATEVEAASGAVPILQYGGGTDDGFVYRLNTTLNDVSTAITSYITIELDMRGQYMALLEILLRRKAETNAGDISVTITANSISRATMTLSATAEVATQAIKRHRESVNVVDHHIAVKLENAETGKLMYLEDIGFRVDLWEGR